MEVRGGGSSECNNNVRCNVVRKGHMDRCYAQQSDGGSIVARRQNVKRGEVGIMPLDGGHASNQWSTSWPLSPHVTTSPDLRSSVSWLIIIIISNSCIYL